MPEDSDIAGELSEDSGIVGGLSEDSDIVGGLSKDSDIVGGLSEDSGIVGGLSEDFMGREWWWLRFATVFRASSYVLVTRSANYRPIRE